MWSAEGAAHLWMGSKAVPRLRRSLFRHAQSRPHAAGPSGLASLCARSRLDGDKFPFHTGKKFTLHSLGGSLKNAVDRGGQSLPARRLASELLAAFLRQPIVFCPPSVVGGAPVI